MSYNNFNIAVFESTIKKINGTPSIYKAIDESIAHQQYYFGDAEFPSESRFDEPCTVSVTKFRTVDAARNALKSDPCSKVAVHNFASATRPGGGVTTGSSAQEECICRVSGLYRCLTTQEAMDKFYEPHKASLGPLHNDDIIYTPNVPVIKTDDYDFLVDPVYIDIITCAAPNLRDTNNERCNTENSVITNISDDELYNIHVSRAKQILNVAVKNKVDVIILGAFGCGSFRNNPYIVAKAYNDVVPLYLKMFKRIEFAVFCHKGKPTDNYDAFKSFFSK